MAQTAAAAPEIFYPESDGQPMGETGIHVNVSIAMWQMLRDHFRHRPDVYIAANMFMYYEQGNPHVSVVPDLYVATGVGNEERRTYKIWEEGKPPDLVLEVTSLSTRRDDEGRKRELYQSLGVGEYWQFDPTGDYLDPPLQGLRLTGGRYQPLELGALPDGEVTAHSAVLGLDLRVKDEEIMELRLHDPATGRYLLTHPEFVDEFDASKEARRESERARKAAEARVADLEARLRILENTDPNSSS